MDLQAPLFKGATRTPCVFGVPIKAFVANIGLFSLLGLWVWVPLLLLCVPLHFYLKSVADKDDQIFQQILDRLPLANGANKNYQEGIVSFSPKQKADCVCVLNDLQKKE
ncbi:VirB3 family type IV secretion system protein [uncultured Turicimonas sp.]|uniref:VirB3 family type IV secretion system protein n=1 Tax=uncultured Turicimonas sp. TaxID=1918607 RepID=UPI002805E408|nr:VirB3 family type IV secretion system protein [uncultured Turicimonas sp.]